MGASITLSHLQIDLPTPSLCACPAAACTYALQFDSMPKLAIIREPIDRAISSYNYAMAGGDQGPLDQAWRDALLDESSTSSFESFVAGPLAAVHRGERSW